MENLNNNRNLKHLDLSNNPINVYENLNDLPELIFLSLKYNRLDFDKILKFVECLSQYLLTISEILI